MTGLRRHPVAAACAATAALLLVLAGCGGGGSDSGGGYVPPKGKATQTLDMTAQNFFFTPKDPTIKAGITNLKLSSKGGIHTLVFDHAYDGFQVEADGDGDSQSEKIDLKPGKYTYYCNIADHRSLGMVGTLTVTK